MGLYVCGDIHGNYDIKKLNRIIFPKQKELTKEDYVVILGDFGLIWSQVPTEEEEYWLDWLNNKNFTTLFVDGNHENFERLNSYPVVDFNGGKAHKIKESIFHLMRGEIFNLCGAQCFVMGGARSHDIADGILDPDQYSKEEFERIYNQYIHSYKQFRIKNIDWWKEELPSKDELFKGVDNLKKVDWKVDFVFSHCAPASVAAQMGFHNHDRLTIYFEELLKVIEFKAWHFGHYHLDKSYPPNFCCHYNDVPWRIA